MNMRRAFLSSVALAFVIAIGAGVTGGSSIQAAQWNATTVPVRGTVYGGWENVRFSGNVQIETRLALDPLDSTRNKLVVLIDLSGVSGTGVDSRAGYTIRDPESVHHRLLAASDVVEVAFPFSRSSGRWTASTRGGLASFSLIVDTATGAVMSASGGIGNVE